jgi:hypothetical protein
VLQTKATTKVLIFRFAIGGMERFNDGMWGSKGRRAILDSFDIAEPIIPTLQYSSTPTAERSGAFT